MTTVVDVIRNKKQGDQITVSETVKWDGEAKTPNNSQWNMRDEKLMDSSRVIDISVWEDHIPQIKGGEFYRITNCKVKHFYGKKLISSHKTVIQPAEKQDITDANLKKSYLNSARN